MKKALVYGTLVVSLVAITGCTGGSNEAKLSALLVDTICTSNEMVANMPDFSTMSAEELTKASEDMEKKGDELKAKIEGLPKAHGFATESEAEAAFKAIANKEEFKNKVKEEAVKKCNPNSEMLTGMLSELK